MASTSRLKFNPITKEVEIEGPERFVKASFKKIESLLLGAEKKAKRKRRARKAATPKKPKKAKVLKVKKAKRVITKKAKAAPKKVKKLEVARAKKVIEKPKKKPVAKVKKTRRKRITAKKILKAEEAVLNIPEGAID